MRVLWLLVGGVAAMAAEERKSELRLLEKFRPEFRVAGGDCDVAPAEFVATEKKPKVLARNGAIYASAFPKASPALPGTWMELHYYHLWGRDCGRAGHALDAEHVSALVKEEEGDWRAVYWYAAAHEDTPCDASTAARARALGAETRGPRVWISAGKHASFFSEGECSGGCRGDRCQGSRALEARPLLALDAGADWVRSKRWPLQAKLASDFSEALIEALGKADLNRTISASPMQLPSRTALGAASLGLEQGTKHTGDALAVGASEMMRALGVAKERVRRWMQKN